MNTSMKNLTKAVADILKNEKTAKSRIGSVSRALLTNYHKGGEATLPQVIELIVQFTNGCTPANRKALTSFFTKYAGFKATNTGLEATKLSKKVKQAKRTEALEALEDRTFNVWAHFQAKATKKPVDNAQRLAKVLKSTIGAKENPLTVAEALTIFVEATDVKPDELLSMLTMLLDQPEAQAA